MNRANGQRMDQDNANALLIDWSRSAGEAKELA